MQGRAFVTPQDVKDLALNIFRHRILPSYEAEAESISNDTIVERILNALLSLTDLRPMLRVLTISSLSVALTACSGLIKTKSQDSASIKTPGNWHAVSKGSMEKSRQVGSMISLLLK